MADNKTATKAWVAGLWAAGITGGSNAVGLVLANQAFDLFKNAHSLWTAIGVSTLTSVAAYLKQSPLPHYDFEGGDVATPLSNATKAAMAKVAAVSMVLFAFLFAGCSGPTTVNVKPTLPAAGQTAAAVAKVQPYLRPGAAAIGVGVILSAQTPADRTVRANYLYAAATAVRTLAGSNPPTVDQLQQALTSFAPDTSATDAQDWSQLIASVSSLYESARPNIPADPTSVLNALESIAEGLEDAAKPYVTPKAGWHDPRMRSPEREFMELVTVEVEA